MEEISNKTLATLLVVAIIISLAGTFFAMRGTQVISQTITGFQSLPDTNEGWSRVNITEILSITLNNDSAVDFGSGYRNATMVALEQLCNLTSGVKGQAAVAFEPVNCWTWVNTTANGTNVSGEYAPNDFVLENDGNVVANVTIESENASVFIEDTPRTNGAPAAMYLYKVSNLTARPGCVSQMQTTETAFAGTGTEQLVCDKLRPEDNSGGVGPGDSVRINIKVGIPLGVYGEKNTSVTFTAYKWDVAP